MRNLYAPGPASRYVIVPRHGERAVLAYAHQSGRYYPVVAITLPLTAGADPFPRLSPCPLPHIKP